MFGQLESWNFGYIFPLHFVSTAPKVLCVLRMQSLLPQCTEQWYAWAFLWGRFRKPSLEAGCSLTISLMPAYNERPCAPQFGRLSVCVCVCVYISLNSVLVMLIGLSGWSIIPSNSGSILCLDACWLVSSPCKRWLTFECPHSAAASNSLTSFSLSRSLRAVLLSVQAHASDGLQPDGH